MRRAHALFRQSCLNYNGHACWRLHCPIETLLADELTLFSASAGVFLVPETDTAFSGNTM